MNNLRRRKLGQSVEKRLVAADRDVLVDFFRIDTAGIFQNDVDLIAEEGLLARAKKSSDRRMFRGGDHIRGVCGSDVLIENIPGFAGDERSERTKSHTTYATHPAVGTGAFDFSFESSFDSFAAECETTGGETHI